MDNPDDLPALAARATRHTTPCGDGLLVWHCWGPAGGATGGATGGAADAAASAAVVVLLHGGSGSWTHWLRNIDALAAAGHAVWVPDMPGFGASAVPPDGQDADVLPGWLELGLQQLIGARPVALVGFSFGALVAGLWAQARPARVARLVLVDLDHVSESNINRQVQALGRTLGMSKVQALRERIADIHPGCEVVCIEDFVTPDNWPALLQSQGPAQIEALIDACDQSSAKATLAAWALRAELPLVCVGAAGGKRLAQRVEVEDLADATHDPLLASLRQRLRKEGAASRQGRIGVRCVFSRESVAPPAELCDAGPAGDGTLNCQGYGSSVTVTATFGLVAAGEALAQLMADRPRQTTSNSLLY